MGWSSQVSIRSLKEIRDKYSDVLSVERQIWRLVRVFDKPYKRAAIKDSQPICKTVVYERHRAEI